jgi:hypothetical protein
MKWSSNEPSLLFRLHEIGLKRRRLTRIQKFDHSTVVT